MDDEGIGYRDHGGEIWDTNQGEEGDSKAGKRRKLAKDEQPLHQFVINTAQKKKAPLAAAARKSTVNEQESKDIMNQLFDDLENAEVLEEHQQAPLDEGPAAFNKKEAVMQQYAV